MFSKGQLIFAICFLIVFITIITFTYKKDLKLHKKYYKGSTWILLAFIAFLAMIVAIKFVLG